MDEKDPSSGIELDLDSLNEEQLRSFGYGVLQIVVSQNVTIDGLNAEVRGLRHELEITKLAAAEEKKFDQKTGLLTSSAFRDLADERMRKLRLDARFNWRRHATEEKKSQFLLFMDLDHFKKLNEVLNHEVVDEKILIPAAERINTAVRGDDDLVGTQGGDEFLVLLMDVDKSQCLSIARRIKASLNEIRIPQTSPYPQLWSSLGVSIGIAEYHHDSDYSIVFNEAHAAHLISKNTPERNQIIFAGDIDLFK